MVNPPKVVILTNEQDITTDLVVRELRVRQVPYLRLNTERLHHLGFAFRADGPYVVERRDEHIRLDAVTGVWHRRPTSPILSTEFSTAEREVLGNQWRALFWGLLALPARWINSIPNELAAETKLLQLATAYKVGFAVPDTLVTNSRASALTFLENHSDGVVTKALDAPYIEDETQPRFVYTSLLSETILEGSEEHDLAPFILQRLIKPKRDVRVTVIEDKVFAAAPAIQVDELDWRRTVGPVAFEPVEIPDDIARGCALYLKELGLVFGAFDFVLDTAHNKYYFLECNPNGEWGWLQRTASFPIASAIVDALLRRG